MRFSKGNAAFGTLAEHHDWVSDPLRLGQTRMDYFDLEYFGAQEPRRLLRGMASGIGKYVTTQTEALSPILSDFGQVRVYESKTKRIVGEVNFGIKTNEGQFETTPNLKAIGVEVKNLGTEKMNDGLRNLVADALTAIRVMSNEELEQFIKTGEMKRIFRD